MEYGICFEDVDMCCFVVDVVVCIGDQVCDE